MAALDPFATLGKKWKSDLEKSAVQQKYTTELLLGSSLLEQLKIVLSLALKCTVSDFGGS